MTIKSAVFSSIFLFHWTRTALAFITPSGISSSISSSSLFINNSAESSSATTAFLTSSSSTTLLQAAARSRGLERQMEGATPTEGGMTLYLKAGPDGVSIGDCPFAQYIRMVLLEKNLEHDVRPSTQDTKPSWLIDHYEGKMPALRHRKECYTESDVIAQYLEFFFQEPTYPSLTVGDSEEEKEQYQVASEIASKLFPAVAKYLKHTPDGDDDDQELLQNLQNVLQEMDDHLSNQKTDTPFFGNGENITLLDCSLAPKLYHMTVGMKHFKKNEDTVLGQYPSLKKYIDMMFDRESFQESLYGEEVVVWGWSNARS